jgi:hypothetical protein
MAKKLKKIIINPGFENVAYAFNNQMIYKLS